MLIMSVHCSSPKERCKYELSKEKKATKEETKSKGENLSLLRRRHDLGILSQSFSSLPHLVPQTRLWGGLVGQMQKTGIIYQPIVWATEDTWSIFQARLSLFEFDLIQDWVSPDLRLKFPASLLKLLSDLHSLHLNKEIGHLCLLWLVGNSDEKDDSLPRLASLTPTQQYVVPPKNQKTFSVFDI